MGIVKLAPNVPESIELKYADLKVGHYGPQVQLKGKGKDGADRILYVPADCAAVLVANGALALETGKGTTYKPVAGWWIVHKVQNPGEKYGQVYLYPEGHAPIFHAPPAPQPLSEKPKALTQPEPPMPWEANPKDEQIVRLYWDCFDKVLEGLKTRALRDGFHDEQLAACVATMFIQRSKAL